MLDAVVQLVNEPTASATVLIDLNNGAPWQTTQDDDFSLGVPALDTVPNSYAAQYGYRGNLAIPLLIQGTNTTAAAALQTLARIMQRPNVWLHFKHSSASESMYLRLYQSAPAELGWHEVWEATDTTSFWKLTLTGTADPYLIGVRHDLVVQASVTNNPITGCYLDVNGVKGDAPTDALLWSDSTGNPLFVASAAIPMADWVGVEPAPAGAGAYYAQAETGTVLQANSANYSGTGSNNTKITFTNPDLIARISDIPLPTTMPAGLYRVIVTGAGGTVAGTLSAKLAVSSVSGWDHFTPTVTATVAGADFGLDLGVVAIGGPRAQTVGYADTARLPMAMDCTLYMGGVPETTGVPAWYVDTIKLIPADWSIYGAGFRAPNGRTLLDGPNGREVFFNGTTATPFVTGAKTYPMSPHSEVRGGIPKLWPGNNRLHFGRLNAVLADTATVSVSYYPRYTFLRPAGG
jgi:hypothetical protein